jgi:ATP-dependent DNA helicase RecQ
VHYHGGLGARERHAVQAAFMEGRDDIIVATSAFGMGIDKPDVRFVYHYEPSDSVDGYYQEIGRAGRDGQPAEAVLFYRPEDLHLRRFFAAGGRVTARDMEDVALLVRKAGAPVSPKEIAARTGLSRTKLGRAFAGLEPTGALVLSPTGDAVPGDRGVDLAEAAAEAARRQDLRRQQEVLRIEAMRAYAERQDCRRRFILRYFGEETDERCDHCDNCEAGGKEPIATRARPFPVDTFVVHADWGKGLVRRYEGDRVVVLFEAVGERALSLEVVTGRGLLEPMGADASAGG